MSKKSEKNKNIPVFLFDHVSLFIFWFIISFLIYISARSISAVDAYEVTFFLKDSTLIHIIVLTAFLLLLYLSERLPVLVSFKKSIEENDRTFNIFRMVLLACIFALSVLFILSSGSAPVSDQKFVQEAVAGFFVGDYSSLYEGGYLHTYPNQLGLVWISYIFFKIFGLGNYLAFRIMNALCLVWFYKRLSDITGFFCENRRIPQILVLVTGVLFYPLQIYCTFVYGTIPGLALATASFYRAFVFYRDRKKSDCLLSVLCICLSMLFKQNYLIFFIALFLHAVAASLREKKRILWLLPVLLLLSYPLQAKLPYYVTKSATGITPGSGASSLSWIAMGLQESGLAEGWYNGYNANTYRELGYDADAQSKAATLEIKSRVSFFLGSPYDAINFFTRKLSSEWNDPSFESYWILREKKGDAPSAQWLNSFITPDATMTGISFLSQLQFLILTGALLFIALYSCEDSGNSILPALTLTGGFLFHIFWEAKTQYTLPYFVLLFPLAAAGFNKLIKRAPGIAKEKPIALCLKLIIPILIFCILYKGTIGKNLTTDTEAYINTIVREYEEP